MLNTRPNKGIRTWLLLCLYAVTFTGPSWAKTSEDPLPGLELVPADAPVAVVVPSLSGLSDKVAVLNEDSLGATVPYMGDMLGALRAMSGITEGLDDSGSLVVVVTDADGLMGHHRPDQPPVVILVPVSDYAALVGNFGGNPGEGEAVTQLVLAGDSPGFAKHLGDYAVIGPTRDQVDRFHPGHATGLWTKRMGRTGQRCLRTSDLTVIVNIQAMEPTLQPMLQTALVQIKTDVLKTDSAPAPMVNLVKAMATIYGDTATALLRDTSAVVAGLDITSHGVGLTWTCQFEPGSYLAQMFTTGRGTKDQLARLPNDDYWLASAMNFRGIAVQTMAKDLLARIPDGQGDPTVAPAVDMFKHATALLQQTAGVATAYRLPDQPGGMMGGRFLSGVTVYETGDGLAYTQSIKEYFEKLQNFMEVINDTSTADQPEGEHQAHPRKASLNVAVKYTSNALQVDGVHVDEYQIQYQLPPEIAGELGRVAPVMMLLGGSTGQSGYVAAHDRFVVMTTTRDVQLIKQALAAIKQTTGFGAGGSIDRVRRVALPSHTVFETYLGVGNLVQGINGFMGMMGLPPIHVPEDLPPIAAATSVEDHGIANRLYVPTTVIRFCKNAVDQTMATMRPGAPGPHVDEPDSEGTGRQGPPPAPR